MNRRTFFFLTAGAAAASSGPVLDSRAQAGKWKRLGMRLGPGVIRFRLDADPDFAKVCCGPGKVYVTDMAHRARFSSLDWSGDGVLAVEVPPRESVAIHAQIALENYGRVWVTLDNEGAGYGGTSSSEPLSLTQEALKSRLARCHRRLKETKLPAPPLRNLELANELAEEGVTAKALREAIVAGEEIEFAAAEAHLHHHGVSPGVRSSVCLFGERLGSWSIGVGPDWPMGAEPPDFLLPRAAWTTLAGLVDETTLPSFWRWIEPERGRYRWKPLDEIIDFCSKRRIGVKSFSLYWGGIGGTPPWFRHLRFDQQKHAIEEWCRVIISRYRGQIVSWETVNEMHDWWFANRMRWTHEQILDVTRLVDDLAGALDPGTPRVIGNAMIWGDYLQGLNDHSWTPITYLEDVIEHGIQFEGIGLHYYRPGRDLMECAAHLDRFHGLKKQVWITEMAVPSTPKYSEDGKIDSLYGWRGPWSEALQADWCEMWYTIALSRPFVPLLNWWDGTDDRAFVYKAGLLDDALKPKPAFERVMSLSQKWKIGRPRLSP